MIWNNWPINLFLWYPIHVLTLLICSKVVGHLEFRCSKLPSWRNRISGQREPCFSCWRSNFSMSESKLKSEFAIKRRITMGIWCAIQCRLVLLTEILLDWKFDRARKNPIIALCHPRVSLHDSWMSFIPLDLHGHMTWSGR